MRMDVDHRDEGLPRCGKLVNVDVPIIGPWYCRINQVAYKPKFTRYIYMVTVYIYI